jgi:succinylarginine dihydrolase
MEQSGTLSMEINFDGFVGPSHNYAGLSLGNIASASHAHDPSFPRAAALQGVAKMRGNLARLGVQGFLLPLPRPNAALQATLRRGQLRACGPPMLPRFRPRPIRLTGAAT